MTIETIMTRTISTFLLNHVLVSKRVHTIKIL